MSISLTWANYALIVSICLAFYYAIVGIVFYRARLESVHQNEPTVPSVFGSYQNVGEGNKDLFGEEIDDSFVPDRDAEEFNPEAQDFADEIVAYTSSCEDDVTKEKLLQSIRKIIQKYPSLKDSNHRYELSQLISISTENYCSIHISAEELSDLWKG